MNVRAVVLVGVLAVSSIGSGLSSAAPVEQFVLEGGRTASVDVVLTADTTFDLGNFEAKSAGRFVGFYAESLDKPVSQRTNVGARVGAVTIRDWHAPGQPGLSLSFGSPTSNVLHAGRYRFYLLADGPSRVSVRVQGTRSRVIRPARPAVATVAASSDILTSPIDASNTQPIELAGERTISFSAVLLGKFRAYVGTLGVCLRRPETSCGSKGVDGGFTGYMLSPLSDVDFAYVIEYAPGALPKGQYEARQAATNVATLQYASGAAFSLALS